MQEEGQCDLGAEEGGHQEHGGDDQAELTGLLLPQQHEAIDNLFEDPFINCGILTHSPHKVLICSS